MIICSPTGTGKTILFELSIIRMIRKYQKTKNINWKAIYICPLKSICDEKFREWSIKFGGLNVMELTSDLHYH